MHELVKVTHFYTFSAKLTKQHFSHSLNSRWLFADFNCRMGSENRTVDGEGYLGARDVQKYTSTAFTVIQTHQNHQDLVIGVLVS